LKAHVQSFCLNLVGIYLCPANVKQELVGMTGPVCCWIYSNSCKLVRAFGWDCRRNCDHIDPQESVLGHQ